MATRKKTDIADHVHRKFGFSMAMAERIVGIVLDEIADCLRRGEEAQIKNFGTFIMHNKAARPGRNPRTGEPATIAARRVPTFHPSKEFKKLVAADNL